MRDNEFLLWKKMVAGLFHSAKLILLLQFTLLFSFTRRVDGWIQLQKVKFLIAFNPVSNDSFPIHAPRGTPDNH